MKMLKIFSLIVKDYDETIQFYTHKLGFKVLEDVAFGEGSRWVTLTMPDNHELEIGLDLATTPEDLATVGKQTGSFPLFGFNTDDCVREYQEMKRLGVKFHGEPESGPWGVGVLLEDLYGNKIFMSQDSQN